MSEDSWEGYESVQMFPGCGHDATEHKSAWGDWRDHEGCALCPCEVEWEPHVNDPDAPEESPSLAAMIRAMQDGEPVDKDALRDALLAKGEQLGLPRKDLARFAGRARWEAERRAENREGADES